MKLRFVKKCTLSILLISSIEMPLYASQQSSTPINNISSQPQNFENCLDFLPGRLDQSLMVAPAKAAQTIAKTYILPATPATTQ